MVVLYVCVPHVSGSQKRVSGPLRVELQFSATVWFQKSNSCPQEEQLILLTANQLYSHSFLKTFF